MAYPAYLKERARELRIKNQLTLDELAERLALPKTTVWHWITDLPLARPRSNEGQKKGSAAMQSKYRQLREDAYQTGLEEYAPSCVPPPSEISSSYTSLRATSGAGTRRPFATPTPRSWPSGALNV